MLTFRHETAEDIATLHALTYAAFLPMEFSDNSEAAALDQLREDGDLLLSLIAERDGAIVGHIAFSPLSIGGQTLDWVALGPISVTPSLQKQGIGTALIAEGLQQMRESGARGCGLVGNPTVYGRSGFTSDAGLTYQGLPQALVQYVHWSGPMPKGEFLFAPGLE